MDTTTPKYPDVRVDLASEDGNVFSLVGACVRAAKRAGVPREEIDAFYRDVTSSKSYDEALQVMMRWFDID